jgi:hypothetical protein
MLTRISQRIENERYIEVIVIVLIIGIINAINCVICLDEKINDFN